MNCGIKYMSRTNVKKIDWWRTDFEKNKILNSIKYAINNEFISSGPIARKFEKKISKFLKVPYVVSTTSGSNAILMALIALGIKKGDEVIIPNRTWIATAHAPLLIGAKVKLVDVDNKRSLINTKLIERKITKKTKAIIPVHINGRSADMDSIKKIARKYKLHVVEDAAQAFGSCNSKDYLGCQSDIGCFSLSLTKLISTGQGGFCVTRSKTIYEKLIRIRTHGIKNVFSGKWNIFGFNFRYNDILASFGLAEISKVKIKINSCLKIYNFYKKELVNLKLIKFHDFKKKGEVIIYPEIFTQNPQKLIKYLKKFKIDLRPSASSLSSAPHLKTNEKFKNSLAFQKMLYLPCGPEQKLTNIKKVIYLLKKYDSTFS